MRKKQLACPYGLKIDIQHAGITHIEISVEWEHRLLRECKVDI
jgi:hypothetical protein